jgi:hypothetical protein
MHMCTKLLRRLHILDLISDFNLHSPGAALADLAASITYQVCPSPSLRVQLVNTVKVRLIFFRRVCYREHTVCASYRHSTWNILEFSMRDDRVASENEPLVHITCLKERKQVNWWSVSHMFAHCADLRSAAGWRPQQKSTAVTMNPCSRSINTARCCSRKSSADVDYIVPSPVRLRSRFIPT